MFQVIFLRREMKRMIRGKQRKIDRERIRVKYAILKLKQHSRLLKEQRRILSELRGGL